MRPTLRWLQQLGRSAPRANSTSFIGLGRMGSEMAYNLFSKQYTQSQQSSFVVCDALPESANAFRDNFLAHFPGANLEVVDTPVQSVLLPFSLHTPFHSQRAIRATLASNTIITMLPSSPHVKQVYSESIIPTLKQLPPRDATQTLCIDSTTLDVDVARAVATKVTDIGAQMVDAPVSGGKSSF